MIIKEINQTDSLNYIANNNKTLQLLSINLIVINYILVMKMIYLEKIMKKI